MMIANTLPSKLANGFASRGVPTTHPAELNLMLHRNEDIVVVDVRETEDYELGHVPGALNVPPSQWQDCALLCEDALNIIYGYSQRCQLAARAARAFAGKGYQVIELTGGFDAWKSNNFEIDAL